MPYYPQTNPPAGPAGTRADVRLEYVSPSVIRLNRCNGSLLVVDNVLRSVPEAGVDLAPTGLTPSTVYYVYAYMAASGLMALEASTAGHAPDPRNGIRVKSGDASRTLVGMAQPATGPVWLVSSQYVLVRTYYNDPGIIFQSQAGAGFSSSSTTPINFASLQTGVLVWQNEIIDLCIRGVAANTAVNINNVGIGIDTIAFSEAFTAWTTPVATYRDSYCAYATLNLSEGAHNFYFVLSVQGGTFTCDQGHIEGSAAGVNRGGSPAAVVTTLTMPTPVMTDCRLVFQSTDYIRLDRCNGYLLTIDNTPQVIPAAGVTLHRSAVAANTFYYIYVYMTGGVMTIGYSTTPPVVDPRNGLMVLSGSPEATLIGAIQTDGSGLFTYSTVSRAVSSYYNRRLVYAEHNANVSHSSTTMTPTDTVYLLTIDSAVEVKFSGAFNVNADQTIWAFLLWDGTSLGGDTVSQNGVGWANATMVRQVVPAPGLHYYQVAGKVSAGTGTWSGTLSAQALM